MRSPLRRFAPALALAGAAALPGCAALDLLSELFGLNLLGILPDPGFSSEGPGRGRVKVALGSLDESGFPLPPKGDAIEVESPNSDVTVDDWTEKPGFDAGSFLLLVDGSGSLEADSSLCLGCPTDGERHRVEAAATISRALLDCAPDWRIGLAEFGDGRGEGNRLVTDILSPMGSTAATIAQDAESLVSEGGTPLWDGVDEALTLVARDVKDHGPTADSPTDTWGRALVVLSDGADTTSRTHVDAVIAKAQDKGVTVHVVGLGAASDTVDFGSDPVAVESLRRLAAETGGFYATVSDAADLPPLGKDIARAHCGGYAEYGLTWATPPAAGERVTGVIRLKDKPTVAVPFAFTAP